MFSPHVLPISQQGPVINHVTENRPDVVPPNANDKVTMMCRHCCNDNVTDIVTAVTTSEDANITRNATFRTKDKVTAN